MGKSEGNKHTDESATHDGARHEDDPFPASDVVKTVDLIVLSESEKLALCRNALQEEGRPSTSESHIG